MSVFVLFVGFDVFKLMNEKSLKGLMLFFEVCGPEWHAMDAFVVLGFFGTDVELRVENVVGVFVLSEV